MSEDKADGAAKIYFFGASIKFIRFILSLVGGGGGGADTATGILNGGKILILVISKPDLNAKGLENLVFWEFLTMPGILKLGNFKGDGTFASLFKLLK